MTSAFFFVSRELYGTIAFHNFLGIFGVILGRGDRHLASRLRGNARRGAGISRVSAAAIGDLMFTILEVLIISIMPAMVALMVAVHA